MKKHFLASVLILSACTPNNKSRFIAESMVAYDKTYESQLLNGEKKYLTVYTEDDQWHVLAIKKEDGKIQDVLFHRRFYNKKETDEFINRYLANNNLTEKLEKLDAPKFVTEFNQSNVWPTKNQWSWEWEEKFALWFKDEVNVDFFKKYNVLVDCADVAYALRWIFSRINYLPAAAHLAASNDLITNESIKDIWRDIPANDVWHHDQRFLTALNFVLENTYTHTLKLETYPIAINAKALTRGTVFLYIGGGTGHTQNVVKIEEDGFSVPLQVLSASVPRLLFVDIRTFFYSEQPDGKSAIGFIRFRWPIKVGDSWQVVDAEKMPHYSLEQFDPEFMKGETNFTVAVLKRLFPNFDIKKLIAGGVENVEKSFQRRAELVVQGYEYCKTHDCAPGSTGWEDWSTPSRDKKIRETMRDIEKFSRELADNYFDPTNKQEKKWEVWTKSWANKVLDYKGTPITLKELAYIWTAGGYNSDPRSTPEERWGIEPESFITNLSIKVSELLNKRHEKIKANTCVNSSCVPGSEPWIQHSTHLEDGELQYLEYNLSRYCHNMPAARCQEYEKRKNERLIKIESVDNLSFGRWIEKSFWLNSDPRWQDSVRWGEFESQWRHDEFNPASSIYRTKSGIQVRKIGSAAAIEDLVSNKSVPWNPEFEYIDYNVSAGRIIGKNGERYVVYDINTRQEIFFSRDTKFDQPVRWVTADLIFLPIDKNAFELIGIQSGAVQSYGTFKSVMPFDSKLLNVNLPDETLQGGISVEAQRGPSRWWLVDEGQSQYSVLDMQKPDAPRLTYRLGPDVGKHISSQYLSWQTEKFVLLTVGRNECSEPTCTWDRNVYLKIDKATGLYEILPEFYLKMRMPYVAIKGKNDIGVFKIDENLKVIQKVKSYPNMERISLARDNFFTIDDQFQTRFVLRVNDDGSLDEYPHKNRIVWNITKEHKLVTMDSDATFRIEDFSGNEFITLKIISTTRSRESELYSSVELFTGNPVKWGPLHYGMYALGKFDQRPLITGAGLFFSDAQHKYSGENPVFYGVNFEEITKIFEGGGYRRPLEGFVSYPNIWAEEGLVIYRNRDKAMWLSPDISKN